MSGAVHETGAVDREVAVFERIEAFRRRKPRLLDEVVTLAHGAGGKASAALLEAVFLPAFANDTLGAQTDAAVVTLPSGDRIAFSTDSYVVHPLQFPAASVGHLAVDCARFVDGSSHDAASRKQRCTTDHSSNTSASCVSWIRWTLSEATTRQ